MSERDRHASSTHAQTSTKVYVGGLVEEIDNDQLEDIFKEFGPIERVWVARHPTSRGYAFVDFWNRKDAEDAVEKLHKTTHYGNTLKVEISKLNGQRFDFSRKDSSARQRGENDILDEPFMDSRNERDLLKHALLTESALLRETLLQNSLPASLLLRKSLLLRDQNLLTPSTSLELAQLDGYPSSLEDVSSSDIRDSHSSRRLAKLHSDKPYSRSGAHNSLEDNCSSSSDSINLSDILQQKIELERMLLQKTAMEKLVQPDTFQGDELSPLIPETAPQTTQYYSPENNTNDYAPDWSQTRYPVRHTMPHYPRPSGYRHTMHTQTPFSSSHAPMRMPFPGRPFPPHIRAPPSTFFSHRYIRPPPRMGAPPTMPRFGATPRMIHRPPAPYSWNGEDVN